MADVVEEERHKAFQALRKKHYEMKDAIKLGHQLEEEDEDDEQDGDDDEDREKNASNTMVNGQN